MHDFNATTDSLDTLAHRRARRKLGWYIHASVYIGVNLVLATASGLSGHHWALFPALGWGLGLLIHGAVTFLGMPGSSLYQQLLARERATLERQRATDPW